MVYPHVPCSQDRLWIHDDQDKEVTESDRLSGKVQTQMICLFVHCIIIVKGSHIFGSLKSHVFSVLHIATGPLHLYMECVVTICDYVHYQSKVWTHLLIDHHGGMNICLILYCKFLTVVLMKLYTSFSTSIMKSFTLEAFLKISKQAVVHLIGNFLKFNHLSSNFNPTSEPKCS